MAKTVVQNDESNGQEKGHEIVEGDDKHPGSRKKKGDGLGHDYGQGIGYGGYDTESDQSRNQTGTRKPT